jgi:2-haloacid dehalogenase
MPSALCFDVYGTLCDTSSVRARLGETLDLPGRVVEAVDATWRDRQLAYSFQLALMDAYEPFWSVTRRALSYALDAHGVDADATARERILAAYDDLEPYPDAVESLERLSAAGATVVVLSNGNPEMLERLADAAGLAPHLDDLLSADAAATFKPAPAVYETAAASLDRPTDDCRLVSANAWDVAGAGAAGMATAWVNRTRDPPEAIGPDPDLVVDSLAGVADAVTSAD